MNNKKIIIISTQNSLRNFFKLEAMNFDFSVDCSEKFEKIHNDLSHYDLAIIDKDTIKQSPLNTAKKELTVSTFPEKGDILYPVAIAELKQIYAELCFNETVIKNENNDLIIYFYKNEKNVVSLNNRKYILSDTEYKILDLLCKSSQNIVPRESLQELFDNEKSNISDVYICKLRKKLEGPLGQRLILTVREKGYKILAKAEWR